MIRSIRTWGLASLALSVTLAAVLTVQSYSQTAVARPRNANPNVVAPPAQLVDKTKLDKKNFAVPTPAELWDRIEKLEAKVAASTKAFETKIGKLQSENEDLMGRVSKLESQVFRPGGQQGLKLKVLQKSFWNRIPNDAWLVYYQY